MALNNTNRALRNNTNNFAITAQLYVVENKVTENASILWNDLSIELKIIASRCPFKEHIKNSFLNTYTDNIS